MLSPSSNLVFDGDSLTSMQGCHPRSASPYGALSNWNQTYANRVAEWIFCNRPDLDINCHIAAIGGSRCSDLLERFTEVVQPVAPAWVVLTIGTNDALTGVPVSKFQEQLSTYCKRLRKHCNGRVLYVGGFLPGPDTDDQTRSGLEKCRPYFQSAFEEVRSQGSIALDVGQALLWRAEKLKEQWPGHTIYSSGLHYNAVGNEIIANQVLVALDLMSLSGPR
jgi:lysophospholipase L1-like esterase